MLVIRQISIQKLWLSPSDAYVISDELAGNKDNDNGDIQDRDENDALRNAAKT